MRNTKLATTITTIVVEDMSHDVSPLSWCQVTFHITSSFSVRMQSKLYNCHHRYKAKGKLYLAAVKHSWYHNTSGIL